MADSKLAAPRPDTASPPPHCAICLGTCKNKCRANSCMHEFCYNCLLEWSKIKAECPLCKQEFKSILHNIKSINEYDVHIVENIPVENNRYLENASLIYLPPATPPMHHYQFRTTLTVDSSGEHAIQQMLLHHPLLIGGFNPDRYTHHRRRRGDTSTSFRRSVYAENLWVYAPPDITGRYRDVSPSYYRSNPAARTRLVPWLNRELNALLHENTQQVMRLVDIILDHLLRHHICSYMFRSLLYEYLGSKTDHFIHEFYNFMRSPFDMMGYDRHVIYTERHSTSPIHFIDEVDVSDYDSDVILVSDGNNNREGQGSDPVIIDLVESDSDEPIIVSEERNEPRCVEEEENRKPILPIKLRIKNRIHKSKERRSRAKKRHRQPTSSSSSNSSSEESSSDSDCDYKRYQQRKFFKKMRREKKKRRESYYVERVSSEMEDDIPLANLPRKKRPKHNKHKSHTVTSVKKEKRRKHQGYESNGSSSESNRQDGQDKDSSSSDESFYSEHKPHVKSKVKEVRSDDKHKAGPSSGRLRNTLKKEASTNLWYSRPSAYDSDSSDS